MRTRQRLVLLQIHLIILLCVSAFAESNPDTWPTWRGPDTMGISPKGNPPTEWSETQNIKWKVKLEGDASNSSPVIWGDKIFFQTAVDTKIKDTSPTPTPAPMSRPGSGAVGARPRGMGRGGSGGSGRIPRPGGGRGFHGFGGGPPTTLYTYNLVCLDRKTGTLLWEKTACQVKPHQGHHGDHGFSSFSPVTDGEYVWAFFGSRGLYCYDVNGKKVWSKELPQMATMFGEGGSPCVAGNAVIVVSDQQGESFIFAFEKKTGDLLWKKARDEPTSHATPVAVMVDGKLQVIVSATNFVRSYDVQNGEVIWQCGGQTRNVIPTPVVGFGLIYCTSGFRGSALQAIKLGKTGDLTDSDAV
ncbi:MAG: PQQ-binding-like beta-propeller repeat protein, partial [Planctomycetes bacterium]|nr:PQQ-binding-like beta-propeller repeat protein [Planctomycetota bacterium]